MTKNKVFIIKKLLWIVFSQLNKYVIFITIFKEIETYYNYNYNFDIYLIYKWVKISLS